MGSFRNSIVWGILLAVMVAISPVAVHAEDSELFINRVWPNVLLMIDRSGSMGEASGSTNIGDLDGAGSSNTKMDALWKVVYTLLNADLSVPPGGGGAPTSISCEAREFNGDDSIRAGTTLSNMRYRNCNGTLPGSGTITISRRGRIDTVAYSSKGTCPGGHGTCLFFSPAVTFTYDHSRGENFRYTGTSSGYWFTLPYPSPASKSGTGGPADEHAQATVSTYYPGTLTSGDEAQLKARIGYMDFTGSSSPWVPDINIRNQIPSTTLDRAPLPSPIRYYDIWQSLINNATPQSYTPTAMALVTAKTFFTNAYNAAEWCRPNYAILITDGEDTMGLNSTEDGTTSSPNNTAQRIRHNHVIEKAAALYDNTYKISLFTVGVGIGVPGDTDAYKRESREVLRRAADQLDEELTSAQVVYVNTYGDNVLKGAGPAPTGNARGEGKAYFTTDATQLAVALGDIFEAMLEGNYVFTSPTISSVRTSDRNYLFLGTFQPEKRPATLWEGHLYSYSILGVDNLVLRWDTNDLLDNTTAVNRKMYSSSVSGSTWSRLNFGTNPGGNANGITYTMLGVANDTARDNVIGYVRGTSRSLKLGDIYHSKPVLVGEPSPFFVDSGYSTGVGGASFLSTYQHRKRVLYAGANDGTLHAFLAGSWGGSTYDHGTGAELFAYLPNLLLQTIRNFVPTTTSSHRYWVDSSPRVADVWLPAGASYTDSTKSSSEWKTVLVTGLRSGGSGYFALDVTNPDDSNYPQVLWEYQDNNVLADSWSEPYIAKIKYRNNSTSDTGTRDRWVAIFGGGMSDSGDVGKTLIVMDLASGVPLKVFGPTGIDNEIVASPTPVLDGSGYIRYIYVPDLSGNLYRFDLQAVGTKNTGFPEWTSRKVFQPTSGGQPAFHRAETGAVTDSLRYVFFGTGNQEYPISDNGAGKFYGIRDADTDNTTIVETSLTDVTSYINSNTGFTGTISSGWKVDLGSIASTPGVDFVSHAGEKVLSDPVVFNGVVYFTTYASTTSNACFGGGASRLYGLNYQTGGAGMTPVTGETPASGNTLVSRHVYTTLGVASSPTLSINPSGSSSIFVGFSGVAGGAGTVKEIQVQSPPKYKTIKSWKEIL